MRVNPLRFFSGMTAHGGLIPAKGKRAKRWGILLKPDARQAPKGAALDGLGGSTRRRLCNYTVNTNTKISHTVDFSRLGFSRTKRGHSHHAGNETHPASRAPLMSTGHEHLQALIALSHDLGAEYRALATPSPLTRSSMAPFAYIMQQPSGEFRLLSIHFRGTCVHGPLAFLDQAPLGFFAGRAWH